MALKSTLVIGLTIAAVAAGCANEQPSNDAESGASCITPLVFEGREYRFTPAPNDYAKAGEKLGKGEHTREGCGVEEEADPGPPAIDVYAFPQVPPEEAIVLTDANGQHGTLYVVAEKPVGGWDPELQAWMDEVGIS